MNDQRRQTIEECIRIAENDPELPGPIPDEVRRIFLEDPEYASRACVRATKASIVGSLRELLDEPEKTYFLVTYESRTVSKFGDSEWERSNESIEGCPGAWYANLVKTNADHYAGQEQEFERTRAPSDKPMWTDYRFLGAVQITKAGFESLES